MCCSDLRMAKILVETCVVREYGGAFCVVREYGGAFCVVREYGGESCVVRVHGGCILCSEGI